MGVGVFFSRQTNKKHMQQPILVDVDNQQQFGVNLNDEEQTIVELALDKYVCEYIHERKDDVELKDMPSAPKLYFFTTPSDRRRRCVLLQLRAHALNLRKLVNEGKEDWNVICETQTSFFPRVRRGIRNGLYSLFTDYKFYAAAATAGFFRDNITSLATRVMNYFTGSPLQGLQYFGGAPAPQPIGAMQAVQQFVLPNLHSLVVPVGAVILVVGAGYIIYKYTPAFTREVNIVVQSETRSRRRTVNQSSIDHAQRAIEVANEITMRAHQRLQDLTPFQGQSVREILRFMNLGPNKTPAKMHEAAVALQQLRLMARELAPAYRPFRNRDAAAEGRRAEFERWLDRCIDQCNFLESDLEQQTPTAHANFELKMQRYFWPSATANLTDECLLHWIRTIDNSIQLLHLQTFFPRSYCDWNGEDHFPEKESWQCALAGVFLMQRCVPGLSIGSNGFVQLPHSNREIDLKGRLQVQRATDVYPNRDEILRNNPQLLALWQRCRLPYNLNQQGDRQPGRNLARLGVPPRTIPICSICTEAEADTIFRPCNMVTNCANCAEGLIRQRDGYKHCPICRQSIQRIDDFDPHNPVGVEATDYFLHGYNGQ